MSGWSQKKLVCISVPGQETNPNQVRSQARLPPPEAQDNNVAKDVRFTVDAPDKSKDTTEETCQSGRYYRGNRTVWRTKMGPQISMTFKLEVESKPVHLDYRRYWSLKWLKFWCDKLHQDRDIYHDIHHSHNTGGPNPRQQWSHRTVVTGNFPWKYYLWSPEAVDLWRRDSESIISDILSI